MKKLTLLLFTCLIVSCSTTNPNDSILNNSQCDLPCWNGITPGETLQPEALQIINGLDRVDPDKTYVSNLPWDIFNKRIMFYLHTDSGLAQEQIDGTLYFLDDKVVALSLHRNVGLTFGELVELVGEPETIISMPSIGGNDVVMAVIPSKGVEFEFYAKSDKLKPETKIDNVMFFDPLHYEDLLNAGMFSMGHYDANDTRKIMYSWKGYGSIEELYPPRFP